MYQSESINSTQFYSIQLYQIPIILATPRANMLTTSNFAVALVAGSAIAQSTTTTGATALNYTYIDISTVDPQVAGEFPRSAHARTRSLSQLID